MERLKLRSYHNEFCEVNTDEEFLKINFKFGLVKAISWTEDGRDVEIPVNQSASCYPFFTKNKIVVLFKNQPEFPKPGNLIIFNGDGSILMKIDPPQFIHPMSLDFIEKYFIRKKITKDKIVQPVFNSMSILKKIDNKEYLMFTIGEDAIFRNIFFETRALDIDTGEWNSSWREFTDPYGQQGWGQTFE